MIKTIIFDLAEVILNGFVGIENKLSEVLDLDIDEVKSDLHGPEFGLLMRGKISEDQFWESFIQRSGFGIDSEDLKVMIRNNFGEIDGTRNIIQNLKSRDYTLGLLSDHAKEWIEYCDDKFGHHQLFDEIQYSYQVGFCKTEKESFEIILQKLSVDPQKTLFIDDNISNVELANSIGINTIQFKNADQLRLDLSKFMVF